VRRPGLEPPATPGARAGPSAGYDRGERFPGSRRWHLSPNEPGDDPQAASAGSDQPIVPPAAGDGAESSRARAAEEGSATAAPETPTQPAAPDPPAGGTSGRPPGLREQARRTIGAGRRLAIAHVDLAKAELAVIVDDAKKVAIQVGLALALVAYVGLLVPVGMALFLGEWIFGSMGWGILHGALFSIATAVALVLGALRVSRAYIAGTLLVAIVIGIAVGTILGVAWPNAAYAAIGQSMASPFDAGVRPLIVGLALWGTVFALLGILGGARAGGVGGAIGGFVGGAVVGALFGAITAISFSLQVGAALGVMVTLVAWSVLAALALRNYDWEDLKRRFTPSASMAAAEETMAFVKSRLPGRKGDAT